MNNMLEEFVNSAEKKGFNVFHLDGRKIHNKTSFMNEAAEKLKLPAYFGHNWDALNDCITDLSWMNSEGVLLIINDSEHFRIASPEEWQNACNIFLEAIDYWKVNGKNFYLLLM